MYRLTRTPHLSWLAAGMALLCALTGVTLAVHHPLAQPLPAVAFAALAVTAFFGPRAWPLLLPALLPIIGFMPWTGWITFEEFDLLVLAVASGGYARMARGAQQQQVGEASANASAGRHGGTTGLLWPLSGLFAVSILASMLRGFADAGGFSFGWFQGYREQMNSLRLAKPFFAALLLYPLWAAVHEDSPEQAERLLSFGMLLGLFLASLAAVWERLAFTDLLNFSADYRTTALFWEMHVGGAALDGFLALTVPFAVREMLLARSKSDWVLAAVLAAAAAYACLTTFSRGVYLAIPAGVAIMMALHAAQQRHSPAVPQRHASRATIPRLALVFGFIVAAAWMFPGSGYRGMLALVGALAVLLPLVPALRRSSRAERLSGLGVGLMLSLLAWGVSWLLPKGPYVVYALGVSFAATALGLHQQADGRGLGRLALPLALGGYLWVLTGVALVAMHWGGTEALWQALPVIGALLLMAATLPSARLEAWPSELRWHGNTMAAVVAAGGLVAIFGGGAYLSERFSTASTDVGARLKHWQLSVSMLDDLDSLLLGQGLGRYVDSYALSAPEGIVPGDYRMGRDGDNQYVIMAAGGRLASGKSMRVSSFSDMLLLSQRTALPLGLPTVSMQVRASAPTVIYVAVCSKHLLYPAGCIGREVRVKADPGVWQSVQVQLAGKPLSAGSWYAPRLIAFVIGIDSSNRAVDIDNIDLTDTRGSRLLSNGDFSAELAHWFFTSDHSHLPWHAKNMAINVLFDQGMLGLALLTALLGAAFWRLGLGGARNHPLAPTLAGALTAYLVVGLFDSLLDVPRVTFVFYWLVLLSLTLGAAEGVPFRPKRASRRQR